MMDEEKCLDLLKRDIRILVKRMRGESSDFVVLNVMSMTTEVLRKNRWLTLELLKRAADEVVEEFGLVKRKKGMN